MNKKSMRQMMRELEGESKPWVMGAPWNEAGRLAVRKHTSDDNNDDYSAPQPLDIALATIDEGFTSLVGRYSQRRGHLPMGVVMELADAWGIEAYGKYALVDAGDPNLIIWPRASKVLLDHLAYLIQAEPEGMRCHPCNEGEAEQGCIVPNLKAASARLYNDDQPQEQARWLPCVFCNARVGMFTGEHVLESYEMSVAMPDDSGSSDEVAGLIKDLLTLKRMRGVIDPSA